MAYANVGSNKQVTNQFRGLGQVVGLLVQSILGRYFPSELRGVNRDSIEYFKILMSRVRQKNSYVNRLYRRYYQTMLDCLNRYEIPSGGTYVELGSGYGFFKDYSRGTIDLVRSDVVRHNNLDMIVDGEDLPFPRETVSAIFMFGVLHHIKHVERFFDEAGRCLKPGGAIIMIEPTGNWFAQLMYRLSHSEPFDKEVEDWIIPGEDPMTCANLALPHVIFERDLSLFKSKYPELQLVCNKYHSPLLFQMSGAGAYNPPLGHWSFYLFRMVDLLLSPFNKQLGMFSTIVIQKKKNS